MHSSQCHKLFNKNNLLHYFRDFLPIWSAVRGVVARRSGMPGSPEKEGAVGDTHRQGVTREDASFCVWSRSFRDARMFVTTRPAIFSPTLQCASPSLN